MNRLHCPGLGMAWPAPRRPTPGGGLAVLVVVTMLAALAAPHAKAVRGLADPDLHELLRALPREVFDRLLDVAFAWEGTAA